MIVPFRIAPWASRSIDDLPQHYYDGILGTLGFEARSRAVLGALAHTPTKAALAFESRHAASYESNRRALEEAGFELAVVADRDFAAAVDGFLLPLLEEQRGRPARIAIDVSSMSRLRMAIVIEALADLDDGSCLIADLLYAPARFAPHRPELESPVLHVEPVSPFFAGWWANLEQPLAVIMGVGYELEHASSAIDRLEPEATHVFVPESHDERYITDVRTANRALFATKDVRPEITYPVDEPFGTFSRIEALVARLTREHRVAVVTLGPKIFAVAAGLACALHLGDSQWIRVSALDRGPAVDRIADGRVCGIRVVKGPVDDTALLDTAVDE